MSASLFSTTSTYDLLKDQFGPLITITEAAGIVGNHVSTWYFWMSNGLMPVPTITIGNSRRIRLIDLCTYLDAQASASGPAKAGPLNKDGSPRKKQGRPRKVDVAALAASSHA